MAVPVLNGKTQFFDAAGLSLGLGSVSLYVPGTLTPKQTWQDQAKTSLNTTPTIALDAGGYAMIYGSGAYRQIVKDSLGNTIWDQVAWANDPADTITDIEVILAASSGSSLVGFIQSGTGAVAETVQTKLREAVQTVRDFGAATDGVTNARPAFVLADAIGPFVVPRGSYLVSTSLTITNDVSFDDGPKLIIPTGVTVTFNGAVSAGVQHIFQCTGTGAVVFNHTKTWKGYAEWWGAKADGATDCQPFISAALVALLYVQLNAGDYLINSVVKMTNGHRTLAGVGCKYEDTVGEVTRLLIGNGSSWGVQVGPDTFPGSVNALQKETTLRDLYIARTVAPVISSNCVGVQMQYVLNSLLDNVKVSGHMIGFHYYGTVASRAFNCESVRAEAGSGAGTDYWRGHWPDGSAAIGLAGGNGSLHLDECSAGCNYGPLQTASGSVGFYVDQNYTDLFIDWPETVNCYDGIRVVGNGATGNTVSNTDLHIRTPIMDQFHNSAIYITTVAEAGSINISDPYCGPATNARASIWVNSSPAAISIEGGQIVHGNAPLVQPVLIASSSGVTLSSVIILEAGNTYPVVGLSDATNCTIRATIKNRSVTGAAAVQLTGTCTANILQPIVLGKASAFTFGIQVVGVADARNEYNLSGIDSTCINAGSGNKLVRNAVQIVATGLTGTNLVSGVVT